MKWEKLGLVYCPTGAHGWDRHSALTPTPLLLDEETIRVYAGFRDDAGVSRIGFVDVDARDPRRVRRVSARPALDVGPPGCFDDNGIILGDVVARDGALWMYYVGFQLVAKAKFLAYTGLAISTDGGEHFERASLVPVVDRADSALFIRAIHSVMHDGGEWRAWLGAGSAWCDIGGQPFPSYSVQAMRSPDGVRFTDDGPPVFEFRGDEYRIGRPRVYRIGGKYRMFFTVGTVRGTYLAGYAESDDGRSWRRDDDALGIAVSESGWDSLALSYPALIEAGGATYMFYNGNQMGRTGFGVAALERW